MSRNSKKKLIIVYTDGSCVGNGKSNASGGIGIHFPNGELADISKIYDSNYCTNQKTELYAILTALRYIRQRLGMSGYKVLIKTDSEYSINCITKWVYGWVKNGWKTKNNTPVANREYIEPIYKYYETYDISFEHVEAHTGLDDEDSIANARADELATKATKKSIERKNSDNVTSNHYKNNNYKKTLYSSKKSINSFPKELHNSPRYISSTKQIGSHNNQKIAKPKIITKLAKNSNFVVELIKTKNNN